MTRRARHGERGSSLPETAIVIAVTLALLFGIIDFGRAMYTYAFVANVAREGARWAIVRGAECYTNAPGLDHCPSSGAGASATDVQTYVQSLSEGVTVPSRITIDTSTATLWPDASGCSTLTSATNGPGCHVVVQVTYPFNFILPYLPGPTIGMTSTSEMVISQ